MDSRVAPPPPAFPPTPAFDLLRAGVPITLLLDLAGLDLTLSRDVARVEQADVAWVHPAA